VAGTTSFVEAQDICFERRLHIPAKTGHQKVCMYACVLCVSVQKYILACTHTSKLCIIYIYT
jgi:hypothetical protein